MRIYCSFTIFIFTVSLFIINISHTNGKENSYEDTKQMRDRLFKYVSQRFAQMNREKRKQLTAELLKGEKIRKKMMWNLDYQIIKPYMDRSHQNEYNELKQPHQQLTLSEQPQQQLILPEQPYPKVLPVEEESEDEEIKQPIQQNYPEEIKLPVRLEENEPHNEQQTRRGKLKTKGTGTVKPKVARTRSAKPRVAKTKSAKPRLSRARTAKPRTKRIKTQNTESTVIT